MKNCFLVIVACLVTVSTVLANGGPLVTSPVFGTGEAGPVEFVQRDVEVVSEDLEFTPGINFVEVDVTYILYNYGEDIQTGYCFPVTSQITTEDEEYWDEFDPVQDVRDFRILQDGSELPVEFILQEVSDSTVTEYGYGTPVGNHLYTTQLAISAGDTTEVRVTYSLRATYEDFESTKDFFPSYQDRRFRYDLRPAAWWGSGTAGIFTMTINAEELHRVNGSMQSLPEGGQWLDDDHYTVREQHLNFRSYPEISFSFESRTASATAFLESHRRSPDSYTVTVSSELGANYGSSNLSDNDLNTTWSEGAEGTTGGWILIEFEPGTYVSWVGLLPGYAKSEYTYTANARPSEATVEIDIEEGSGSRYPEPRSIPAIDWVIIERAFNRDMFWDAFNRGESYRVESIKITFTDVIPGTEFEDLCISELVVATF